MADDAILLSSPAPAVVEAALTRTVAMGAVAIAVLHGEVVVDCWDIMRDDIVVTSDWDDDWIVSPSGGGFKA